MDTRGSSAAPDANPAVEALLQRAGHLLTAGRNLEAEAALQAAIRLDPENPDAPYALGVIALNRGQPREAETLLRRAVLLDPEFAVAHQNIGIALQMLDQSEAAIDAYRHAVSLEPELAEAHAMLADALASVGRRSEARASHAQAAAAAPSSTVALLSEAKLALDRGRTEAAESPLRQAIAREPMRREAHRLLGTVLDQLGRFDEAASSYERVIALDPGDTAAYFALLNGRRITPADRLLLDRVAALAERPGLGDRQRMPLHFALGKALDDLGEPARAIRHFDAANAARARLWTFDADGLARWVDRLIGTFTTDYIAHHAGLGAEDATPVLILGMPRSGTTLIEQILSRHPRIGAAGELTFWNVEGRAWDRGGVSIEAARRMISAYQALLREAAPEAARVTDKMPYNFQWIGLVHILFPSARFIHVRRDPVDTCLSVYRTLFDFDQGWMSSRENLVHYYRQYARLMAHWRAVLPGTRLLEVDYETLVTVQETETRRMVAFCGLDWDDACLHPERSQNAIRTASLWQARQPVHADAVERWRRYEPWLGALRDLRENH